MVVLVLKLLKWIDLVYYLNSAAVTGVCYVRPIKTIWVAAGTAEAAMYDPKSGENVSSKFFEVNWPLIILYSLIDNGTTS